MRAARRAAGVEIGGGKTLVVVKGAIEPLRDLPLEAGNRSIALWAALLAGVRFCIIAIGYVILAASIVVRFAMAVIALVLFLLGGVRWDVVKRRTLGAAQWVDVKVLAMLGFFRRRLAGGASR